MATLRPIRHEVTRDGVWPEGIYDLSSLRSRTTVEPRRDVFWSGDWIDRGNPIAWKSRDFLRREANYFGGEPIWPDGRKLDTDRAENDLLGPYEAERLLLLGLADQWRTLTLEQASALSGVPLSRLREQRVFGALTDAGLVDYGTSLSEVMRPKSLRAEHLPIVRPASTKIFERLIRPRLTFAQWAALTGGEDFAVTRQFDRHNLLATEFAIRLAEYAPKVAGIVGEKLSGADKLFGVGPSQMGADFIAIRSDGLKIAFELTASTSPKFREKVDRWARLLNRFPHAGVVVVFLEASKPASEFTKGGTVMSQILKQVGIAASGYPGLSPVAVRDRMFVASYSRFFPGPLAVNAEEFFSLRCLSASSRSEDRWEFRDVLDEHQVPLAAEVNTEVLCTQVNFLLGSPWWLREDHDPLVWNELMRSAGFDRIVLREPRPGRSGEITGTFAGIGKRVQPRSASRGLVQPTTGRFAR